MKEIKFVNLILFVFKETDRNNYLSKEMILMFQNMFNAEGSGRFIRNTAFVFTFHKDTDEEI